MGPSHKIRGTRTCWTTGDRGTGKQNQACLPEGEHVTTWRSSNGSLARDHKQIHETNRHYESFAVVRFVVEHSELCRTVTPRKECLRNRLCAISGVGARGRLAVRPGRQYDQNDIRNAGKIRLGTSHLLCEKQRDR